MNVNSEPDFAKIRLFVEANLAPGAQVALGAEQAHYIRSVMRRNAGDAVRFFNGRDGEWSAELTEVSRKSVLAMCMRQMRPQDQLRDIALLFAPIKRAPMAYLVEKATELGVTRFCPIITGRTQGHANPLSLRARAIEAAEQSWRLGIPDIAAPIKLSAVLAAWPAGGRLLFCDEASVSGVSAPPMLKALQAIAPGMRAHANSVLIGPEGGFSPEERDALRAAPFAIPVSLGPRIVRAETAAVMALTLWQCVLGDLADNR